MIKLKKNTFFHRINDSLMSRVNECS